jgi:ABC-type transport system involved in cytochrome bd biosynthesis fused ATPase/permease subunit
VLSGREAGVGPWLGQLTFLAFAASVNIRAGRAGLALIAPDLLRARTASHTNTPANLRADSAWQGRPQQEIRLEEVSFRYVPDQPWALMGISLRIPARAAVGIVGVNGSGKLENGKITGSGTYDGLLKSSAVFRRMTGVR